MPDDTDGGTLAGAHASPERGGPWGAFSPLRHRNYRLLWTGLLISQTGSWMQFIALGYLIDQLTREPVYLGLLGLSQAVPRLLFAFLGGVAADRLDRQRVLLWTNLSLMATASLLSYLAYTDQIQVWHVLAIGAFNSLTQSFDSPARQSLMPFLVGERELMKAISLNSMAFNGSGIFGPSLGGVMIAFVGVDGCFLVNALSTVAVLLALLRMKIPPQTIASRESIREDIREGIGLLLGNRRLLAVLGVVGVISFFGRPYIRLMPAYAREVLHLGPKGLGALQSAPPVGTVLAVFLVGALAGTARKGELLLGAALANGVLVVLFGASTWFLGSLALLILMGTGQAVAQASANTLLQTSVRPEQRGRMMGLYNMVTFGMFSLGTLPLGALAGSVGVGRALMAGGLTVVAAVTAIRWLAPGVSKL